jgi:transketolase
MTANETDPATRARSTRPEAPAEAASDAPTGNPSQPRPTLPEGMGELDRRAIDTVRVLAMDAVQKAGNGHPGTAMSMGPTACLLFQKWLRHDPGDSSWARESLAAAAAPPAAPAGPDSAGVLHTPTGDR